MHLPIKWNNLFGLLTLNLLQGWFEYSLVIFCFHRVTSLKLLMLKVIKSWFANNDFLNTEHDTIEQDLNKSACQRN